MKKIMIVLAGVTAAIALSSCCSHMGSSGDVEAPHSLEKPVKSWK